MNSDNLSFILVLFKYKIINQNPAFGIQEIGFNIEEKIEYFMTSIELEKIKERNRFHSIFSGFQSL